MSDWVGKTLGQYEITAYLGRGGMSTVYRARQASIGREVAIKILTEQHEPESPYLQRFQREVKTIAGLEHIHILPIYDFGTLDGYPYLVMRYLDGGSLNQLIRQRALEINEVERLITQICTALDFAHENGVIHRDMKPHNVLLDRQGNAYLCDFGIAKTIGVDAGLTRDGEAVGTPSYMAPEQWQGLAVSPQTDIYSVGVMLYEMLTGHEPFQGDSLFALMYRHMNESPRPASLSRPGIPPMLDAIIDLAMRKLPAERYQTAGELAAAVHTAIHPQSAPAFNSAMLLATAHPTEDTDAPTEYIPVSQPSETFGGRTWILDAFSQWLASDSPVLYMYGPHGIGKSTFVAYMANALGNRALHYEFDATQVRTFDPRVFVEALIMQLAALLPESASPSGITDLQNALADPLVQFDSRILEPISREREPVFLVLDGLDAALDQPGSTVLDVLRAALEAWPDNLRMVVTSTPHPDIDTLFRRATHIDLTATDEHLQADLRSTLSTRFATLMPNLSRGEVDLNELLEKSAGNPLYLNTVFDCLALKRIQVTDLEQLPVGLEALYADLLNRADAADAKAGLLLRILAVARAPVPESLIAHALGESEVQSRTRLGNLRPLAKTQNELWTLYHPALRYWLLDAQNALHEAHLSIAEALVHPPYSEYALQFLPTHLAMGGQLDRAFALLTDLTFLTARLERFSLAETTHDFSAIAGLLTEEQASVLDALLGTLRDATQVLRQDPTNLFGELYNRLIGIPALHDSLQEAADKRRTPWLRLVWPVHSIGSLGSSLKHILWRGAPITALSVDGSRWLAACADGYLRLWENGEPAREWVAHAGSDAPSVIRGCALREQQVMSTAEDGSAHVWDVVSGDLRQRFRKHPRPVNGCSLSPDGGKALTVSEDRLMRLWDTLGGKLISSFSEHSDSLTCCTFASGDTFAISGSVDGTLRVYKTVGYMLRYTLKGHKGAVTACVGTPESIDPPLAISAATDGQVYIWNLRSGTLINTLKGAAGSITGLALSGSTPETLIVAASSQDGSVRVWNVGSGELLARFESHRGPLLSCALDASAQTSPTSGVRVLAGGREGSLYSWTLGESEVAMVDAHAAEVRACAFDGEGTRLITASLDRELRIWEPSGGRSIMVLKGHTASVTGCAISADGRTVLSASTDKTLRLWDAQRGAQIRLFTGHTEPVLACDLSKHPILISNKTLWLAASGSADRMIRLWDVESGQNVQTLKGHRDGVIQCIFSPLDNSLASISKDRSARLWSLERGIVIQTFETPSVTYTTCAFSPDTRFLLLGQGDGKLALYDRGATALNAFASGRSNAAVTACGFSPNGRLVFAATQDGIVYVWDFPKGQLLATYRASRPLMCGAITNDQLAIGDDKGAVALLRIEGQGTVRRKSNLL